MHHNRTNNGLGSAACSGANICSNTRLDPCCLDQLLSVWFHCKLVIEKSKMQFPGDRVAYFVSHADTLTTSTPRRRQIPPLMAYHHFHFICFIYFLVEGTTSAQANTKDKRLDTGNQSNFSGAFLFPVPPSRHNGISVRVD